MSRSVCVVCDPQAFGKIDWKKTYNCPLSSSYATMTYAGAIISEYGVSHNYNRLVQRGLGRQPLLVDETTPNAVCIPNEKGEPRYWMSVSDIHPRVSTLFLEGKAVPACFKIRKMKLGRVCA